MGESGSGKSTLAKMILGLEKPTSGSIIYKDKKLDEWLKKNRKAYLKEVQPIFQDPYAVYNPFYKVERVLSLILKNFNITSNEDEAHKIMVQAMEDIGLRPKDILGRYPHQISGGERQRLMLARILLMKPNLIMADEPVSMIDVSLKATFLEYLKTFRDKLGISSVYITHDLNTASFVSNNIMVMCNGKIVEKGPTHNVIRKPLHPYTKILIDSILIPNPRERGKERGNVTLLTRESLRRETGCVFSSRCPWVEPGCKESVVELVNVGSDREVACLVYAK
ncbi:MAG: ABC transporter ATP-binding protein [Thermoproteota archaeon]